MEIKPFTGYVTLTMEVEGSVYRTQLQNVTIHYKTTEQGEYIFSDMLLFPPSKVIGVTISGDIVE